VLAAIGVVFVWIQQPLLVPSLGSAVFVQVMSPTEPSARPWNTAMGQVIGLVGGMIGIFLAHATTVPNFLSSRPLILIRVLAVAIGAETADWSGAGRLLAGILLVTALGEAARQFVLRTL
jgi:hypothetical protein